MHFFPSDLSTSISAFGNCQQAGDSYGQPPLYPDQPESFYSVPYPLTEDFTTLQPSWLVPTASEQVFEPATSTQEMAHSTMLHTLPAFTPSIDLGWDNDFVITDTSNPGILALRPNHNQRSLQPPCSICGVVSQNTSLARYGLPTPCRVVLLLADPV